MSKTMQPIIYDTMKKWENTKDIRIQFYKTHFIKQFSYFLLKLFSNNLIWCLRPLVSSFLLLNTQWSSKYSMRCTFSAKHTRQKFIFVLPYTFLTIDHLILDITCSFFSPNKAGLFEGRFFWGGEVVDLTLLSTFIFQEEPI